MNFAVSKRVATIAAAACVLGTLALPAVANAAEPTNLVPKFTVSVVSPTEKYPYNIVSIKSNVLSISGRKDAWLKTEANHLIKASGYVWAGDIMPQVKLANGQVQATVPTTIKISWDMSPNGPGAYAAKGTKDIKVNVVYTGTDYPHLRGVASWTDGVVADMPSPEIAVTDKAGQVTKWRFDLSGLSFFGRLNSKTGLPANPTPAEKPAAPSTSTPAAQSTPAKVVTSTKTMAKTVKKETPKKNNAVLMKKKNLAHTGADVAIIAAVAAVLAGGAGVLYWLKRRTAAKAVKK